MKKGEIPLFTPQFFNPTPTLFYRASFVPLMGLLLLLFLTPILRQGLPIISIILILFKFTPDFY